MDTVSVRRVSIRSCPKSTSSKQQETPTKSESSLLTLSSFGIVHKDIETDDRPIKGTYNDDLNIVDIHRRITKTLAPDSKKAKRLQQKRDILLKQLQNTQTVVQRKRTLANISKLEEELEQLTSGRLLNSYIEETKECIAAYTELGQEVRIRTIGKSVPVLSDKGQLRLSIISRFLDIASRYVDIDISRDIPYNPLCPMCGYDLSTIENEERAATHCPSCGLECNLVNQTITSCNDKVGKNNYEDRENFLKALKRFQGKQVNKVPSSVMDKLDDYFRRYNLPLADEVKCRPLDSRGKREGTTLDMLLKALSEVGCSSYYEDVNLIGHIYWGWDLPDLSHLEESIMDDYDKSQRIFEEIKDERKSSLNTQYRLYRHLEHQGFPCSKNDFKMVTTREILEYYEEIWKTICSRLNWTFHPMI